MWLGKGMEEIGKFYKIINTIVANFIFFLTYESIGDTLYCALCMLADTLFRD